MINLAVVDAIPGACANAAFLVSTLSDTSEGTLISPTGGNIDFGASPEPLTIQAPGISGGSAVFQAICEAGCESVTNPNPIFTVNIGGDIYAIDYFSPTSGFVEVAGGSSTGLSVLLSRNGMPGDLNTSEREVCFDFAPGGNPLGATITGGLAPCGNGGRLADADPMGIAAVTLVAAPNMCGDTLVQATAIGFPMPDSRLFTLTGLDPTVLSGVTGDGQEAVEQTPFPIPLRARLQCGTGSPTPIAGKPLLFERVTGASAALAGGLSETVVATDAAGEASVAVFATAIPGTTLFRACVDGPADCDSNAEFSLLTLGASQRTLEVSGAAPLEAAPGSSAVLAVQALNDSLPAASVGINWTAVSGGGSWSAPTSVTDASGVTQNTAILPPLPGLTVLRAERADAVGTTLDFDIEAVLYSFIVDTPPIGEPGVPLIFGAGVQRQGDITEVVPEGIVSWSIVSGPSSASLGILDDGLIVANRSRFELLASETGVYVVRGEYSPPSGLPPVFTDIPIEILGSTGGLEARFAPPEFQLYSDEVAPSGLLLTVLGPGQGAPQPLPGFFVEVTVASGDAIFAGGGSTLLLTSDENGQIRTPPIEVGSSVRDVRIVAGYEGIALGEIVLPVTASTYSIQFIPPTEALTPGSNVAVGVSMSRTGSGSTEPFWGAPVQWTAQGGRLQSPVTVTERDGRSFNRLTVDAKSLVVLEAAFSPGGGLDGASLRVELAAEGPGIQIVSGDGQAALPGTELPNPVVVEATLGGLPQAGVPIQLRSEPQGLAEIDPPSAITDASGRSQFRVRLLENAQAGLRLVASRADAPEASVPVRVEVGAGPALRELVAISGGGQFTPPGAEFPELLVVEARNDGQAAGDVAVRFEVTPRGAASVTASSARTSADGRIEARVQLGAAATGPVEVVAVRSDEPTAIARFALFPATGGGEQRLEIDSGNQQLGVAGSRAQPLVVRYLVNGQGVPGARVDWQVLSGGALLDQPFSVSDAEGRASQGLRFGVDAGEVRVRASIENLDVVFVLQSRPAQLEAVGGNAQRAAPGQALPEPLRVRVLPDPIAGLSVEWRVLSGEGQLEASSSQTDASGEASMRWTLGPQSGIQTAAARLPGGIEVVFEAEAEGLADGQIRIVSGNNQQLVTGVPSEPLVIELVSASGQALTGVPLLWSTSRGLLIGDESTSTGPDGRSSNRVQLELPGEVRVRVRVADTDLALEFVVNGGIAVSPGAGGRRRSVAEALDVSCEALSRLETRTAQQQDLLDRCRELADAASSDVPGIGRALDQLPNDVGLTLARAGDESMRGQVQNVDQRLRTLRGERNGAGGNRLQVGLGLSTPGGVLPLGALPSMAMAVDADALEREIGESFERWGAFVTGSIGRGRSRGNGEGPRFDYSLGSLTAGVDYRLSDRLVLGAAVGYSRDETEFSAGRGTLDSSGTSISAFASFWLPQSWYLDANLSAGRNSFDLERSLVYSLVDRSGTTRRIDQRAWADTDARLLGGSLTAGRDWQRRSLNVGTYLRAQFSRIDYDAFEERMLEDRPGSGLALRVESPTWNSMEGVLGMRASWALSRDWGVLMPNLLLEYSHEFREDPSRLDLRFVADPTGTVFSQSGAQTDTSHVNFGLGTSILLPGGRSGFIQYERRLFDDRISHWLLSVGGRFEF